MNFDLKLDPILKKVHYIFVIPCLKKKIQNPSYLKSKVHLISKCLAFTLC